MIFILKPANIRINIIFERRGKYIHHTVKRVWTGFPIFAGVLNPFLYL